ncbi:MAG TPA: hypothetical protein DCY94_03395 [Firmicutes bacterium]|nr:hypothetical protein [Bacillota bacterium]
MNISIIGSGVYGIAVAKLLLLTNENVTMWTEKENINEIEVPNHVILTHDYEESVKDADIIFVLTGTKFVKNILESIKTYIKPSAIIVLGSKGILENGDTPLSLTKKILNNPCAVLSGPTFARDVAALDPVGFTLATDDYGVFETLKEVLNVAYLEYNSDVDAIELLGSLKNAYAIGSGIIAGLNHGYSTSCLYITRIINEIQAILTSLQYDPNSIISLAGIGDLVLTCTSTESRNYTYGSILAASDFEKKKKYLQETTVEGCEALTSFMNMFKEKRIDAPIMTMINEISEGKNDPQTLIGLILN